jgi:hypothetical protein
MLVLNYKKISFFDISESVNYNKDPERVLMRNVVPGKLGEVATTTTIHFLSHFKVPSQNESTKSGFTLLPSLIIHIRSMFLSGD